MPRRNKRRAVNLATSFRVLETHDGEYRAAFAYRRARLNPTRCRPHR